MRFLNYVYRIVKLIEQGEKIKDHNDAARLLKDKHPERFAIGINIAKKRNMIHKGNDGFYHLIFEDATINILGTNLEISGEKQRTIHKLNSFKKAISDLNIKDWKNAATLNNPNEFLKRMQRDQQLKLDVLKTDEKAVLEMFLELASVLNVENIKEAKERLEKIFKEDAKRNIRARTQLYQKIDGYKRVKNSPIFEEMG